MQEKEKMLLTKTNFPRKQTWLETCSCIPLILPFLECNAYQWHICMIISHSFQKQCIHYGHMFAFTILNNVPNKLSCYMGSLVIHEDSNFAHVSLSPSFVNLSSLILYINLLSSSDLTIICSLPCLKTLSLIRTIVTFPTTIGMFLRFKRLLLNSCDVTFLCSLPSLLELYLFDCKIYSSFEKGWNLESLELDHTIFDSKENTFLPLLTPSLKYLFLFYSNGNSMKDYSLCDQLSNLTQLEIFSTNHCLQTILPIVKSHSTIQSFYMLDSMSNYDYDNEYLPSEQALRIISWTDEWETYLSWLSILWLELYIQPANVNKFGRILHTIGSFGNSLLSTFVLIYDAIGQYPLPSLHWLSSLHMLQDLELSNWTLHEETMHSLSFIISLREIRFNQCDLITCENCFLSIKCLKYIGFKQCKWTVDPIWANIPSLHNVVKDNEYIYSTSMYKKTNTFFTSYHMIQSFDPII